MNERANASVGLSDWIPMEEEEEAVFDSVGGGRPSLEAG